MPRATMNAQSVTHAPANAVWRRRRFGFVRTRPSARFDCPHPVAIGPPDGGDVFPPGKPLPLRAVPQEDGGDASEGADVLDAGATVPASGTSAVPSIRSAGCPLRASR